jgi:hypothetical protein
MTTTTTSSCTTTHGLQLPTADHTTTTITTTTTWYFCATLFRLFTRICSVFNDFFQQLSLYSVQWKGICELWIGKDLEGSDRGLILRHYPGFRLEGLGRNTENLCQYRRSPCRNLNPGPSKYEAGMLTTRPRHSVLRHVVGRHRPNKKEWNEFAKGPSIMWFLVKQELLGRIILLLRLLVSDRFRETSSWQFRTRMKLFPYFLQTSYSYYLFFFPS